MCDALSGYMVSTQKLRQQNSFLGQKHHTGPRRKGTESRCNSGLKDLMADVGWTSAAQGRMRIPYPNLNQFTGWLPGRGMQMTSYLFKRKNHFRLRKEKHYEWQWGFVDRECETTIMS